MRLLAWCRTSRGRGLAAALLLSTFVAGSGIAAWHVASTESQPVASLVPGDAGRVPTPDHDDQDCRICGSTQSSLLPPPTPVVVAHDDDPRPAASRAALPAQRDHTFAGPLGSRAPPSRSSLS